MATDSYVIALLGGLEANTRKVLTEVFRYVIPNGRFGPVEHQEKAESFQGYYAQSTTAASTAEFSIVHGMGRAPYLAVQVLPLDSSGGRTGVPLEVSRPADSQRVYLKSTVTEMPFTLYLE